MLKVKQLTNLLLPLATLLASASPSNSMPMIKTFAADDGRKTLTVNSIESVDGQDINFSLSLPKIYTPMEEGYVVNTGQRLFRNVKVYGDDFFGDGADYLPSNVNKDLFHFDSTNVNLYYKLGTSAKLGISYSYDFIDNLTYIASYAQRQLQVPALIVDGKVMATFTITSASFKVDYFTEYVNSVRQATYFRESHNQYGAQYVFLFEFKSNAFSIASSDKNGKAYYQRISEVMTPTYSDFYESESELSSSATGIPYHEEKRYEYDKGFIRRDDSDPLELWLYENDINRGYADFLPYEITYFDYAKGDISLGHSVYGDKYGGAYNHAYLTSFSFTYKSGSISEHIVSNLADEDSQSVYFSSATNIAAKKKAMGSDFIYASRKTNDNEDSSGTVWSYKMPYAPIMAEQDAIITIDSITLFHCEYEISQTFYAPLVQESLTIEDINEEYTRSYSLSIKSCEFAFHYAPCTGIATQKVSYFNFSSIAVTHWQPPWYYYVGAAILFPGVGLPLALGGQAAADAALSSGKNFQRLYFELKDGNEVIDNIKEISFRVEYGHQNIKYEKDKFGHDTKEPVPYNPKAVEYKSIKFDDGHSWATVDTSAGELQFQKNGLFAYGDGNSYYDPENGVNYKHFYQNVYETSGSSAYSNFINFWTPMTVTYEMPSGSTKRLTTAIDGTYVAYDENGKRYITSIQSPGTKIVTGEDAVDEYIATVATGTEYGTTQSGEKNDTDKIIDEISNIPDNIKSWWDSLFEDAKNQFTTWVIIAAAVVLGIVFVIVIVKLIGASSNKVKVVTTAPRYSRKSRNRNYPRKRR